MTRHSFLPRYSKQFYLLQVAYLLIAGVFCFWFSRQGVLDHEISDFWFDPASRSFPLQDSYWLELINHKILKYLVIAGAVGLLVTGVIKRRVDYIATAILIGLGSAAVGILKSVSHHSCPWDLVEYGGNAVEYPLLSTLNYFDGPGRCFPGGHASGGFSLMALFFLFYPKNQKLAFIAFALAMLLGQIMGFGQVVRGAHFLSHNLWSCWWVWVTQVSVYWLISTFLPERYCHS
jgi:membrane-associated PAP2 superfamily phosphatase